MNTRVIAKIVVSIIAVCGVVAYALGNPATKPSIEWTPATLSVTAVAGRPSSTTISFRASERAKDIEIRVVPEIAAFVTVTPSTLSEVRAGEIVHLHLGISAPATAIPASLDGTIQVRASRVLAKPLPVKVTVVLPKVETEVLAFEYPGNWHIDDTVLSEAQTVEIDSFTQPLPGGIIPSGGAQLTTPVLPLRGSLDEVIARDTDGDQVHSVETLDVAGVLATRIHSTITFGRTLSYDRVTVYVPRSSSLYKFILTYNTGDPAFSQYLETLNHALDTAVFVE